MQFKVPKFLERETKIFNFLTFKQLALVGIVGMFLVFLYYIVPKTLFFVLVLVSFVLVFAFVVVRINGVSLGDLVLDFFGFFLSPKKLFWQKQSNKNIIRLENVPIRKLETKKENPLDKAAENLTAVSKSRLAKLSSRINMKKIY